VLPILEKWKGSRSFQGGLAFFPTAPRRIAQHLFCPNASDEGSFGLHNLLKFSTPVLVDNIVIN
jgi:hypothetical protein